MFMRMNKRGQSTLEYGILIAVVVGALLAMSVYMKRGLQGRMRSSTDDIGDQYSAGNTTGAFTTIKHSESQEVLTENQVTTTTITADTTDVTGSETVSGFGDEQWNKW